MNPSTMDMLRAYLTTASLASVFIATLALAALEVFGISDEAFQAPAFRAGAFAAVIYLVLLTKKAAELAFHTAVANRHSTRIEALSHSISVSRRCPRLQLVILHLRFSRRLFDLVD